jgi:hypothetical protein
MITAQNIQIGLWQMVKKPQSKIHGNTRIQKSAFRQLLQIAGGVGFLAFQPAAELRDLGRRGICTPNLNAILQELAGVELRKREKLRDLAGIESEIQSLLRQAVGQQAQHW